jgi:hypothetical protein
MPVNHHLRPLYRVISCLCGLYVLVFGIVAVGQTTSLGFFAQDGLPSALGLRANTAFAILSIVVGVVVIASTLIGRNVFYWVSMVGGIVFLVAGLAMLALLQTDLNFLGFSVATCVVSFVIGVVLFSAGLYGRVGTPQQEELEDRFRHGSPDPERHPWQFKGGPKPPSQTEDHRFA